MTIKFDSADVEAERRSDEIFETLDALQRFEIVRAGVVRLEDDEEAWSADVCACLEKRCRAWWAAREAKP